MCLSLVSAVSLWGQILNPDPTEQWGPGDRGAGGGWGGGGRLVRSRSRLHV